MLNKKIMLLTLLIVSLLAISNVSASEITNDTYDLLNIDNNDSILDVNDDELLEKNSDGTFTDLANEIANAAGELNLTRNYNYNDEVDPSSTSTYGINIVKSIIINGNGYTINGNNQVRIFQINAPNVVLNNINFVNYCLGSSGGAISWYGDNGILFNCSFINSTTTPGVTASGGAIYWIGNDGTLYDCNFMNTSSNWYGGAIYWTGNNGALYDCSFKCSKASSGGAVYWMGSNGRLYDCSLVNCSAYHGGAIYWNNKDGALFNCSFVRCISRSFSAVEWYANNYVMSGCSFVDCAEYMGVAMDWKGYNGVITNCSFVNSHVTWSGYNGVITNCSFVNSYVDWLGQYGSLYGCSFANSSIYRDGGAICWEGDNGKVYDCSFVKCYSYYWGGAIYWHGSNGFITNCSFKNCSCDCAGGAIFWSEYASKGIVTNCSFVNCSSDDGAGVFCWRGADGVVANCTVVNCGGYYIKSVEWYGSNGGISNCSFVNSPDFKWRGGCIYWFGTNGILFNCSFVNFFNRNNGGAIYWTGDNGTIFYCSFVNCSSEKGGGIYFKGANCSLYYSIFKNTTADVGPDWYNEQPIIVINRISTVIFASNLNIDYGVCKELIATLKDVNNTLLAGEQISILLNNVEYALKTDSQGRISLALPNLTPKKYTVIISYAGNIQYDSSNTAVKIVVSKSNTNVSIIYNNDARELVATLTNNGTGQAVEGATVGFKVNNKSYNIKTDANGQSKLSTIKLPLGANTVTATFNGNANYKPSNTTMDFTNKVNTDLLAVYDSATEEVVITLRDNDTGKPLARGNIIVKLAGTTYKGKTDANGQFRVSTANLAPGYYTSTVTYKGTSKYTPSKTTLKIPIHVATRLSLDYNVYTNQIIAILTHNTTNQVISGENIALNINGVSYTAKTNSFGQSKVSAKDLTPGTYTVNVEYKGNNKYASSSASATFTIKIATAISAVYDADSKELIASLTNDVTVQPILGATVTFKINKVTYKVSTDNSGQAKLSVADFPLGAYDAIISYGGNSKYNPASTIISVPIKANTSLDVTYDADAKQFITTLTNDIDGKPISDIDVNVELNGATYTLKTNSNGQVNVSTASFAPDVYPASVSFSGNSMYNPADASM
ncbi:hypothetical protein, partial [Methanobrevibacter sp.]|uniref:hypothetical protein n=1 Tax=Methanobrevibacter sp. TaxID=66852 RepID=UPI00386F7868